MSLISSHSDLRLLNIGESEHHANWNWNNVHSPFARLLYVRSGSAYVKAEGRSLKLKPKHLYLIPPFTLHDSECDGYYSQIYVHFYEITNSRDSIFGNYIFEIGARMSSRVEDLMNRLLKINPNRQLKHFDPQKYDNTATLSDHLANNRETPLHIALETKGILLQLFSLFMKNARAKNSHVDSRITESLLYIQEKIDHPISLSQLSDMACVTEDHFIRLFKKNMNCTPLNYINERKIEKAQLLLITTDKRVCDIAFDLSIDNISYFNRLFKKHTGKTPSKYRMMGF